MHRRRNRMKFFTFCRLGVLRNVSAIWCRVLLVGHSAKWHRCEFTETCTDRHPASLPYLRQAVLATVHEPLVLWNWKPKSLKVAQFQLGRQLISCICLELLFLHGAASEPKQEKGCRGMNKHKGLCNSHFAGNICAVSPPLLLVVTDMEGIKKKYEV